MNDNATKPAAPSKPAPSKLPDDAIRLRKIFFKTGADLPTGQQIARIDSEDRTVNGGVRYEIAYVPRLGMYYVRAFRAGNEPACNPFLIPREWGVAETEPA